MAFLTDPSISQQVRTPNLAQVYLQAQALKSGQQEQQLRSLSLAQATQSMQDNQDLRSAYSQAGGDPTAAVAALKTSNPYVAQQESTRVAKAQKDAEEAALKVQKAKLENTAAQTQGFASLLDGVKDANDYQGRIQTAVQKGFINPDELQHIPAYSPEAVQQLQNAALTHNQQVQAELQKHNAEETARHNTATEANTERQRIETERYHTAEIKNQNANVGLRAAEFRQRQQAQNFDQDASIENQAQQIASGDVKSLPQSRMNPRSAAIMKRVYEINPQYSDALYNTKQNFKTKGDAQTVVQLTTALDHLDSALANSSKVGFAPFLGQNATEADSAYNQDIKLFTQEAGKLVANKAITQHEYEDLISGMKSRRQGIRDAALKETVKLMGGKVEGLLQKYKTGTGKDLDPKEYFDQTTQDRLAKYGIGGQGSGGMIRARDPQGQLHEAPAGTPLPAGWKAE
jgi:hypothetical protein